MADLEFQLRLDSNAIAQLSRQRTPEMMSGMRLAGQFVEREAKRLAPVRTGNLRRSIYHEVTFDSRGIVTYVGTNVKYGIFQELGTRYHPAQPFLRPALMRFARYLAEF